MHTVYVLQHLHVLPDGEESVKLIGVYSWHASALEAVERKRQMPGFRDFPAVIDPAGDATAGPDGFYIGKYQVDLDYWSEGYETLLRPVQPSDA